MRFQIFPYGLCEWIKVRYDHVPRDLEIDLVIVVNCTIAKAGDLFPRHNDRCSHRRRNPLRKFANDCELHNHCTLRFRSFRKAALSMPATNSRIKFVASTI